MNSDETVICLLGQSALDRAGYRLLLEHELGLDVAAEASFAPASVCAALRAKPDLVVVDADAPIPEIQQALKIITKLCKQSRVLLIGAATGPTLVLTWTDSPICGYVLKDGGIAELRTAINAVSDGDHYYSDGVREPLLDARSNPNPKPKLSRREAELLPLLARGLTLREAAAKMTVSYKTADSYRTSLLRKLGLRDRVDLARYAIREHIVEP
jgi:DNA-binding NarL/FixJ family response regulator